MRGRFDPANIVRVMSLGGTEIPKCENYWKTKHETLRQYLQPTVQYEMFDPNYSKEFLSLS